MNKILKYFIIGAVFYTNSVNASCLIKNVSIGESIIMLLLYMLFLFSLLIFVYFFYCLTIYLCCKFKLNSKGEKDMANKTNKLLRLAKILLIFLALTFLVKMFENELSNFIDKILL